MRTFSHFPFPLSFPRCHLFTFDTQKERKTHTYTHLLTFATLQTSGHIDKVLHYMHAVVEKHMHTPSHFCDISKCVGTYRLRTLLYACECVRACVRACVCVCVCVFAHATYTDYVLSVSNGTPRKIPTRDFLHFQILELITN